VAWHEHGIAPRTELGLAEIGLYSVREWRDLMAALAFSRPNFCDIGPAFTSLKRLRPISIARHVYDTGITPSDRRADRLLISVIIAYMSAQQLRRFGAEIFVVDLVTIGVLREMACCYLYYRRRPLGECLCGRAGSMKAQRGSRCPGAIVWTPLRPSFARLIGS